MNEFLLKARACIGALTPLNTDCGALCGGACCETDADGKGGVYLFPGESADEFVWGHVDADDFGQMLICDGPCDREHRPFACRIFPLTPVQNADGKWTVRLDARAKNVPTLPQRSEGHESRIRARLRKGGARNCANAGGKRVSGALGGSGEAISPAVLNADSSRIFH